MEDASQVGEGIRTGRHYYSLERLAHTLCWIISFENNFLDKEETLGLFHIGFMETNTIDDILWFKYPGVGYRCL